jgi:hypothetical protein
MQEIENKNRICDSKVIDQLFQNQKYLGGLGIL